MRFVLIPENRHFLYQIFFLKNIPGSSVSATPFNFKCEIITFKRLEGEIPSAHRNLADGGIKKVGERSYLSKASTFSLQSSPSQQHVRLLLAHKMRTEDGALTSHA